MIEAIAIGVGGNVGGEPAIRERFTRAREALAELGDVRSAALYRTAPIGPAQPDYLNTAIRVRLAHGATPGEVAATLGELERLLGRTRATETRWGPRAIDLDVLVWSDRVVRTAELTVPHPRLAERRFALLPLIDLLGEDAVIPGQSMTLGALAARPDVRAQVVELIADAW